jgi:hypothetical protein
MARNNWANEAFRKAQNLMSRGYDDFEPISVVTKQELNNLKTALLSDEQIARDNEQQPEQWYKYPDESEQWAADGVNLGNNEHMGPQAKTQAYVGEDPIFGKDFDLDTIEQDAIDYEEKNAYRNKDPERAQSDWDKFAAPDELTETEYKKKQGMLAIQAIQKEIEKVEYGYFTKLKPGEREERDARIAELKREQSRLMEIYRARDWSQGTPNEEVRKKAEELEQYAYDNRDNVDKGQQAWEANKDKLDPNFVGMIDETIPGLVDDAGQLVDKAMNWIDNLQPLAPFTDAMKKSESSGDYKSVNTKGYMGAYQFGEARLKDYKKATGKSFTKEEFLGNKELQDEVFDWHVDDIKQYMSKTGLDSWVGKKILGVEVTLDGLVAIAHLGGKTGLKKFLESDGKYNPADEYGTTLKDYLRKFGK